MPVCCTEISRIGAALRPKKVAAHDGEARGGRGECTNSRVLLGRGSCADYGPDHKSPRTVRFALTHTSAEALGPIRNQASEPIATAPLSAAMIQSSQDILPILLQWSNGKVVREKFVY